MILYLYDELSPRDFLNRMNGIFAFVLRDKAFLGIAARGTARWFLERTVEAVSTAATASNLPAQPSRSGNPPAIRRLPLRHPRRVSLHR